MQGLRTIREFVAKSGARVLTRGLNDNIISRFETNKDLQTAVAQAVEVHQKMQTKYPELLKLDEYKAITQIQKGYMQFYDANVRQRPNRPSAEIPFRAVIRRESSITVLGSRYPIDQLRGFSPNSHHPPSLESSLPRNTLKSIQTRDRSRTLDPVV